MSKGILIDMGDTLLHHKISFDDGASFLWENITNRNVSKEEFFVMFNNIKENTLDIRKNIEISFFEFIRLFKNIYNITFEKEINVLEEGFSQRTEEIIKILGVDEFLQQCRSKNYKIGVLSNSMFSSKVLTKQLNDHNLYFDFVLSSADYFVRKPSKLFFEIGVQKLQLDKKDIYFIGNDLICDVYGANTAGIKVVWFNENNIDSKGAPYYLEFSSYQQLIEYDL